MTRRVGERTRKDSRGETPASVEGSRAKRGWQERGERGWREGAEERTREGERHSSERVVK